MHRPVAVALLVLLGLYPFRPAHAAEVTRVVSGSKGGSDVFDFNLTLSWLREDKSSTLKREQASLTEGGASVLARDLLFHQTRNSVHLRADAGVFQDFGLFLVAPIVISDDRSLAFDRSGGGCTGGSSGCVDETNSSFLRDGFLPGANQNTFGLDAPHDRPFVHPSEMVFRGPTRKGLEYLAAGLSWAVFNQHRDDTKPTWIVRFESRFSVTNEMRFDPASPTKNLSVDAGYHQLIPSMWFSRQMGKLDPYLGGWYMFPIARASSAFKQNPPLGTGTYSRPQARAGMDVGLEGTVWEQLAYQRRVALEVRGRLELRFAGLARSELWEPLSGSAACPTTATACRPDVDRDRNGDGNLDPATGITRSPAYGLYGGDVGLNAYLGRYVRFRALVGMLFEQDRFLSDGRSGFNLYDIPGRRFRVESSHVLNVNVEGALLF